MQLAYQLYPLVSSELLIACLELAIEARKVDMRASPYDVAEFEGCETVIAVESEVGRLLYIREQEKLAKKGYHLRQDLINAYLQVMQIIRDVNEVI